MRKQTYKEKQDRERAALIAAGLISDHYPGISNIELQMIYYRRGINQVLLKRTLSFSPADYAGFHLKCMHEGCANGGYDLAPVIAAMAKARKKETNGKIFCHGRSDMLGHASLAYEVKIQYCKA